jgi:hypothetical protein
VIDFKNKKVMLICAGIAVVIIALTITGVILKQKSDDKKAQKAEQDRIAQEEKRRAELDSLAIIESLVPTESEPVETPAPVVATTTTPAPVAKTTPAPTPVATPTPTPTPAPVPEGPLALTIGARDFATGNELFKTVNGSAVLYFASNVNASFVLSYTPIAGTTMTATIEDGASWLGKVDDLTYYFNSSAGATIRIDLTDGTGKVVATGKVEITTGK